MPCKFPLLYSSLSFGEKGLGEALGARGRLKKVHKVLRRMTTWEGFRFF
jgi:hypothetical protein